MRAPPLTLTSTPTPILLLLLLLLLLLATTAPIPTRAQRLFISKYVHASTGERAVEVFNPSCLPAALDEFRLVFATDGGEWDPSSAVGLTSSSATVAARSVHAVCGAGAAPSGATCHETAAGLAFDGDDAVGLFHNWVLVDQLGRAGAYSDASWRDVAGVREALTHHTLLRGSAVGEGVPRWGTRAGNSTLRSGWSVLGDGLWPGLGVSHAYADLRMGGACPLAADGARRLRRLTCGTRGDSSEMAGSSGDTLQVECPGDCVRRASHLGHVFGGATGRYGVASLVCLAVAHAAETPAAAPDAPDDAALAQAASAASVSVSGMAVDAAVLMDAGAGADLAAQEDFVAALAGALNMRVDGRVARVAVLSYAAAAAVAQPLTADESLVAAGAAAVVAAGAGGSRDLEAGLDAARAELVASGRLDARRLVVALGDGGSFGGDFAGAAARLAGDGVTVAVVTADAAGAGTAVAAAAVATGQELHVDVASASLLAGAGGVGALLGLLERPCAGDAVVARPRATVTLRTSAAYMLSGADTACGRHALSPAASVEAIDVAALAEGDVACDSGCAEADGGGRCDRRRGVCVCEPGRTGDACDVIACAAPCYNGGACDTATGECACAAGFEGPQCLERLCAAGCNEAAGGGACGTDGRCACRPGFSGPACEELLCAEPGCSSHGRCDPASGTCVCDDGFAGPGCELRLCPSDCTGFGGVCDYATGHCACGDGGSGSCSVGSCPDNCSGRGVCNTETRLCACDPGFIGWGCERNVTAGE